MTVPRHQASLTIGRHLVQTDSIHPSNRYPLIPTRDSAPYAATPTRPVRQLNTWLHATKSKTRPNAKTKSFTQQTLLVHGPDDLSKRPFKLVIVESPSKCATISNILQEYVKNNNLEYDFVVTSCMGHVRDLPQKKAYKGQLIPGIDVEGDRYEPTYVLLPNKRRLVSDLKDLAAKAQQLVLATDDDREGEAMAWHLLECLQGHEAEGNPHKSLVLNPIRVRFTEITPTAITTAIDNYSSALDHGLVQAQETRRILDRLAGFTVSPVLWKKISPGLSAGRVQSVGMALVVERERQRLLFKPSEYWDLSGRFSRQACRNDKGFDAKLVAINDTAIVSGTSDFEPNIANKLSERGSKKYHLKEQEAKDLAKRIALSPDKWSWKVADVKSSKRRSQPPKAFITSTLQQEANKRLSLSVSQTMQCAQRLYENGYISYMRTDSNHLSNDALSAIEDCITSTYGASRYYQPPSAPVKNKTSNKVNPQAAHEAVRPAIQTGGKFFTVSQLPSNIGPMERKLYEMIFQRTVASCMPPQISNQTTVSIEGTDGDVRLLFRISGSVVLDPGYTAVYSIQDDNDGRAELPPIKPGQALCCHTVSPIDHVTQPPARYTEASFVRELERLGVGRPSTYATVVKTLRDRGYVGSPVSANQDSIRSSRKTVSGPAISAMRAAGGDEFTGAGNARGPMVPSLSAFVVCSLLEDHCPMYVDAAFTARMEERLDQIANTDVAEAERIKYLDDFYKGDNGLAAQVSRIEQEVNADDARRARLPSLADDREDNAVGLFIGPWGPYVQQVIRKGSPKDSGSAQQSERPMSAALPPGMAADLSTITQKSLDTVLRSKQNGGTILGHHPADGRPIHLKVGRFGSYLQWGEDEVEGTTTHSLPRSIGSMRNINSTALIDTESDISNLIGLSFEQAVKYVELPKTVATLDGVPIVAGIGPYGPYLKYNNRYSSLKKKYGDILSLDAESARMIVTENIINKQKGAWGVLAEVGEMDGSMITVKQGRFGVYVNWKNVNAKMPAKYVDDPEELPMDVARELIKEREPHVKSRAKEKKGQGSSALVELPDAPKRPLSAYMHFCSAKRPEVLQRTGTIGEASKELARLWSELSEKDREPYQQLAAEAKSKYVTKKDEWQKECQLALDKAGLKTKSTTLSNRSASLPKRPKSAYLFFCDDKRGEVSQTYSKLGDISKELGRRWKSASDEDKRRYLDLAAQDKERYANEMSRPTEVTTKTVRKNAKVTEQRSTKRSVPKKETGNASSGRKKRGVTAYIAFCSEHRASIVNDDGKKLSLGETTKRLAEMWRSCDDATKAKYARLAEERNEAELSVTS